MKNVMKKVMACLLMAVMVVSVLGNGAQASAASLTAKQYLAKMEKAYSKAKSFESTQTTTMVLSSMGQTATTKQTTKMTTSTKMTTFKDPIKQKQVTTSTQTGQSSSKSVSYLKEDADGKIYMYSSTDGSEYEKLDVTELFATVSGASSELDVSLYSGAKIVKKTVKVGKVNTVKISASISGKDMADAMELLGFDEETTESLGVDFKKCKPMKVTVYIDKKTYRPVKMVMDQKNFVNSMMDSMGMGSLMKCEKATTTMTYKNFNKAKDFSLPAACK